MLRPHQRHYAIAFLLDCGVMVAAIALPFLIIERLNGSEAMIGAIAAVHGISYATLCIVSQGFVSRAKHGLHWAVAGIGLYCVSFLPIPYVTGPLIFTVLTTLAFLGMALTWPALHSWLGAEPDPRQRSRRMYKFNIAWSLGFTVGPLIGGAVCAWGYAWPIYISVALAALALWITAHQPHERDYFGEATEEILSMRAAHDRDSETFLYAAWLANFGGNALNQTAVTIFAKRVDDLVARGELGLFTAGGAPAFQAMNAATVFSWLAFVLAGASALIFLILGKTARWRHRFIYLAGIQIAAALAFAILGNTQSYPLMVIACAAIGASRGFCFFSAVYYSLANAQLKHRRSAMNEAMVGFGNFTGTLLMGLLVTRFGYEGPFACAPAVMAVMLMAQYMLIQSGRRRVAPPPPCEPA